MTRCGASSTSSSGRPGLPEARDRLGQIERSVLVRLNVAPADEVEELRAKVAELEQRLMRAEELLAPQDAAESIYVEPRPDRGNAQPDRARHDLETGRGRPRLLAVELNGNALSARTVTVRPRSSSAFGWGRWVPR